MTKSAPQQPISAILLFIAGILTTTTLSVLLTWASLEADFYGFQRYSSGERLDGLSCPRLMTPRETGSIVLDSNNPSEKVITPIIRIDTNTALAPDTYQEQLTLQPGETQRVQQPVSASNIDLGYFIFAKAYRYPAYPLPSAESACGIMILDMPFLNGSQIFTLWLVLSLLITPLGLWRWEASIAPDAPRRDALQNASRAMALVTLTGLLVSVMGLWLAGMLLLAISVLLAAAILRFATLN